MPTKVCSEPKRTIAADSTKVAKVQKADFAKSCDIDSVFLPFVHGAAISLRK